MEKKTRRTKEQRQEDRAEKRADRKQAKKTRKKKVLDIDIDTKRVDIEIDRDDDGNLDVEWDGKHIDGKYSKKGDNVSLEIEINDSDTYLFEANGTNRKLPKGAIWKVTGAVVKGFLKRGWGKLKK